MTEPEFHISSRARTISSNVPKRKMERGRRTDEGEGEGEDARSVASGSALENHLLHQHYHQNYNPNMMKIFNDLQAFQCSGKYSYDVYGYSNRLHIGLAANEEGAATVAH